MMKFYDEKRIEIPFSLKNDCWFCGEPYKLFFSFPHEGHIVLDCPHPPISIPACDECFSFAKQIEADSIWHVHRAVKSLLHKTYQKDLAIGLNWTPEQLAESGFEGGCFEGFQKSAWFMYEVAKQRVNYPSWPITYEGEVLSDETEKISFSFDGVEYPTIDIAITQYVKSYGLNKSFLVKVLDKVGRHNFAAAVRFCRLNINATPQEREIALQSINDEGIER